MIVQPTMGEAQAGRLCMETVFNDYKVDPEYRVDLKNFKMKLTRAIAHTMKMEKKR